MSEFAVTIPGPEQTRIHHTVNLGHNSTVWPFTTILEGTDIGANCVIGAGVFLVLLALLIGRTFHQLRTITQPDLRGLLAALAAPLVGMVVIFFGSAITAGSPGAPYLWASAGVLAYWLGPASRRERSAQASVS